MIRKLLFAILLTHSALIAQGKTSRIILQAPPVDPNQNPVGGVPGIPPPNAGTPPNAPLPPIVEQTVITNNPNAGTPAGTTSAPQQSTASQTQVGTASTSGPQSTASGTTSSVTTSSGVVPPVLNTPTPVTPAPVTPAPVTPAPVTPAPVTPAPVTPAPTTPAPTTPRPTTPAPTTPAPTTPRPTPFPTTPAPTTASPTLAPLPAGYEYGMWGQVCPIPANEQDCPVIGTSVQSEAQNNFGVLNCDRTADCCKCTSIQCGSADGLQPHGCVSFMAGDYGAYGVKQIAVIGDPATGGASVDCSGRYSCAVMRLFGDSVTNIMCNTDNSCANAQIQIDNPVEMFQLDCNGRESCNGAQIIVNVGTAPPQGSMCNPDYYNVRRLGGVRCNAINSCDGLQLTINNRGCDKVIIENLDLDQVSGATFNFVGDIEVENCVCGPTCNFAAGLGKCFQNLERLICPDIRSCMNMVKTIINPMNGFYLECSNELSCAMADLTIDLEQDTRSPRFANSVPVRYIDALKFGGENSGRGATIHIHNHQDVDPAQPGGIPVQVTIGSLECSSMGACQGLTIYTGTNVIIQDVFCGSAEACMGCTIRRDQFDAGRPCDPILQYQGPQQFVPQGQSPQFVPQGQSPQFVPQGPPQLNVPPQFMPRGPPQFVPQPPQQPGQGPQFPPQQRVPPQFVPGVPRV